MRHVVPAVALSPAFRGKHLIILILMLSLLGEYPGITPSEAGIGK